MRYVARFPCVLAGIVAVASSASARESKPKDRRVYYTVAQISGADRSFTYEIIETRKVAERRRELAKEYQEAIRAWNREAADFRKSRANRGKRFDKPRPAMTSLLAVKQNVRGREAAQKIVAELEARHSVVRIKGTDGKITQEAVQSTILNTRKAELDRGYDDALARWQKASAAFRKENPGGTFSEPKPAKPSLIVLQKDLKGRAAAEALIARLQKKAQAGAP